jgi:hypothetical protein
MAKVKRINIFSFGKFQAALFALLGLLAGILYSFGGLVIDALVSIGWISSSSTPGLSFGTVLAFCALIGMPIIFANVGFLTGIVEAVFNNLYTKWFGGVEMDFEQ